MNSTPAETQLDTLFPDDPVDMDMSGFEAPEGAFLPAWEAGTPTDSTGANAEVDFSFLDGAIDEDAPGSLVGQVPAFLEKRIWSSLAVVLLLHATLAWLFPISAKPPAESPKIIEAQLVLLPGGSDQAGGGKPPQAGPKAGEVAKSVSPAPPAAVPPPPAVPVKKEAPKPHKTAKVDGILPAEQKIHPKARKRLKKIARVVHHHEEREEVATGQPIERSQTDTGTMRPQSSAAVAPGTGKGGGGTSGGAKGPGGTGNVNGPGGSGPSEIAFGSPNGPRFLHEVAPCYPALARRLEKQGTVLLRVTIDAHGRPVKVEVLRKAGFGMDEEAVKAVEESTFVPARVGGQPLTCRALLPIKFVLETS